MKQLIAKVLGWAQFALEVITQASNGHFPQNKTEWVRLLTSAALAVAVHHAASTDGQK